MVNADTLIGIAIIGGVILLGGAQGFNPEASINTGGIKGNCIDFGNNGCEDWLYDNTDKLETVSADALNGYAKTYEGKCTDIRQGKCVERVHEGQRYVWAGSIETAPDAPKALTGCILGVFCGGNSNEAIDEDETQSDGEAFDDYTDTNSNTWEEVDDEEDTNTDSDVDVSSGSNNDDESSSSSSSCSWWELGCNNNDDEDEEDEVTLEETRYECQGDVYSNGKITGYEELVKVEEYSDGSTETEVINSINAEKIAEGETPKVCTNPTGSDASMTQYRYELNFQTFLGKLGLL